MDRSTEKKMPVLKGVIQVKFYFYQIVTKIQTKEEILNFLKARFRVNFKFRSLCNLKNTFFNTFFLCLFHELLSYLFGRSIRQEVFCKKGVLRNFTKFTGKHLCQSLFFIKVAGLVLKKDSGTGISL